MTTQEKWAPLEQSSQDREKIWSKNRTFAGDVWFRFRRKPTAIAGFVLIVLLLVFSLFGPLFTSYSYFTQDLTIVNVPPLMKVFKLPDGSGAFISPALTLVGVDANGSLTGTLPMVRDESGKRMTIFDANGAEVALYYGSKTYVVADEETGNIYPSGYQWNRDHLLGTDALGRDILARLMYGTRVSLMVAFVAVLVNLVIGIVYGGISGYAGGMVDNVMMRIVDVISTIPLTLYVILIMQIFGQDLQSIIIALGCVYWVDMARVVRGEMLSLKKQEYVSAAHTMGSSTWYILRRHLIPNTMGPIIVTATMQIPSAIFTEAFMSFIGLGVSAPMASLGTMCNDALETLQIAPYQLAFPAGAICIAMFAFNFIGDGLRDAFDPQMRK